MHHYLQKITTNSAPAFNASLLVGMLQAINIATVYTIVIHLCKVTITIDKETVIYIGLGLAVVVFVVNFIFLYNRRGVICEQYQKMPAKRRKKGQIYFWLYVTLTMAILCVMGYILDSNQY